MHDLIIVGGGVAGCRIASSLDMDVLLLEKSREIKLKDSGIVSRRFIDIYGTDLVKHEIRVMEGVSPSGKRLFLNSDSPFAYIIDRIGFSKFLRKKAREKAEIKYEFAENIIYGKDSVSVITNNGEYEAKMVVGCDGTLSGVRKFASIGSPKMYPGMLVRTRERIRKENIQVFFNKFFSPEFFSWVIPQISEYGLITGIRPKEHLDYFRQSMNLPGGRLYSYLIPLGTTKSYSERTILVGDACGQSKPITGGGIVFSLRASAHAEAVIKEAFERGNFSRSFLHRYEARWKKDMAWEIEKQSIMRRFYRKMGNSDIDAFFSCLGKSIESVKHFDYDNFTGIWKKLPLRSIAEFMLSRAGNLL